MITKEKWDKLRQQMTALDIDENDLLEKFIIGSGKGGQKLHKTASVFYLKHHPSGIEIKCQESRLRDDNRYFARKRLCEKVDELINKEQSKKKQLIEKLKRQKKRRSRRAKEKILQNKKHRSHLKQQRQKPQQD